MADFAQKMTAGPDEPRRLSEQAVMECQTCLASKQGGGRLPITNFALQSLGFYFGHIRRIGSNEVYGSIEAAVRDWLEQVTLDEFDLILHTVPLRILLRNDERRTRDIDGDHPCSRQVGRKGNRYTARPGPNIYDQRTGGFRFAGEHDEALDQKFSFRAWNQNIGRDNEIKSIDLLMSGDVLQWFPGRASIDQRDVGSVSRLGELFF